MTKLSTNSSMMSRVELFLAAFVGIICLLATTTDAQTVNARSAPCPHDTSISGYTSISALNQDQFDEATRIGAGTSKPSPPYSFVLCPDTKFDMTADPLKILLSGSVFSCGSDTEPSSTLGCFFTGGMTQVQVADSTTPNYGIYSSTMVGVTFEMFNGTAVDVTASESLTFTMVDVVWRNFLSDFIVRQQRKEDSSYAARVEVAGAVIDNGIGGSLFSNDGGVLTLDKLIIGKVTAAGLLSTSNRGITMVESSMISRSTIDTVASVTMGGSLSTMNVDIFDMVFTNKIFHAENSGSKLLLNNTIVRDIDIDTVWTGVHVVDSANAILDEFVFDKNHKFESLVHAQDAAEVQIMNSLFEGNVGRSPSTISNAVYALLSATINLSRTKFNDNTNQTALVFATMKSSIVMEQSCIMGGVTEDIVFVSHGSSFAHLENNVADNVLSSSCPSGGDRLSIEQEGTKCYQETSSSCEKSCGMLSDHDLCMADMNMFAARQVVNGTNVTMPMEPNMTTTLAPTSATTATPNGTIPPIIIERPTDVPVGNETIAPTDDGTETPTTRVIVSMVVRNDMEILDPEEVKANGLGDAFPVYIEELVTNLTTTTRLDVVLVPGSAEIYEVFRTGCVFENRTTMMTTTNFTTCHQAMGKFELRHSPDEDPDAVRIEYTVETRKGIDDGTFQQVLLRVEPDSPLLVGPSLDLTETMPPAPPTSEPAPVSPTCAPIVGGSRSKGSKGSKSRSGSKGKGQGMRGRKMMRRGKGGKGGRRRLQDPVAPEANFENALKDHDDGTYYAADEHAQEEALHDATEIEVDDHDHDDDDLVPEDECVEPEEEEYYSSSRSKGKGSRRLKNDVKARVHGAHHNTHTNIADLHKTIARELEADGLTSTIVVDANKQDVKKASLP